MTNGDIIGESIRYQLERIADALEGLENKELREPMDGYSVENNNVFVRNRRAQRKELHDRIVNSLARINP